MKKLYVLAALAVFVGMIGLTTMGTTYTKSWVRTQVSNYGPILTATHVFSGTVGQGTYSQDTVLFPFTPLPITPGTTDTVVAAIRLETGPSVINGSGDSTYVIWQYQTSMDNTSWATASQIAIDSAATTTAIQGQVYYTGRTFILGIRGIGNGNLWPPPYMRIRAIGSTGVGSLKNDPATLIRVTILR